MQRRIVHTRVCEGVCVCGVVTLRCIVGHHVGRVCRDRYRLREIDLLPARGALAGKGRRGQLCAGAGPEMAHMRALVRGRLIETDTEYGSISVGPELQANLDRIAVPAVLGHGHVRSVPYSARTDLRSHRYGHATLRRLHIAAVIRGAALDRDLSRHRGGEAVAPAATSICRMPRSASVAGDLHRAHNSSTGVCRRARHRHRGACVQICSGGR